MPKKPNLNLKDHLGWTALMYASARDDDYYVEKLIDCGANPDDKSLDGRTALMIACEKRCSNNVKALIRKKASIDILDSNGGSALTWAIANRAPISIIKELSDAGADPKKWPKDLLPQMFQEATEWDHNFLQSLIKEQKCDINARTKDGKTALMIAAEKKLANLARYLIESKAELDSRDDSGRTPLMVACQDSTTDLAEVLLEAGVNVNASDDSGNTPLMSAAYGSGYWVAEKMLEKGAKVNSRNKQGMSAMLIACRRGDPKMVNSLLKYGADIEPNSPEAKKALIDAAGKQGFDTIRRLLDKGVDPDSTNDRGLTPVLIAAQTKNHISLVDLLKHGANVNVRSPEGKTALIEVACRGCVSSVRVLLSSKHIDLAAEDNEGITALNCAKKRGFREIAEDIEREIQKKRKEKPTSHPL